MRKYDLVVASDDNYIKYVSTLLCSVLANLSDEELVFFHLLSNGVSSTKIAVIERQLKGKGELNVYDISNLSDRLAVDIPATIALTSYARLFMGDILPISVSKVLYLDCDVIVNGSLSNLFSMDISNFVVGGVLDTLPNNTAKVNVGLSENMPYINAGILLINLCKWREENVQSQLIDFLLLHHGNVYHHDQGIINGVLKNRILILLPQYNLTSNYFSHKYSYIAKRNHPFYSEKECLYAKKNPVILHYTEGFLDRPWVINSVHPYKDVFLKYKAMSYWKDEPLQRSKKRWYVKLLGWEFLYLPLFFYNVTSKGITIAAKLIKGY